MSKQLSIIVAGGKDNVLTEDDYKFLVELNPSLVIQGGSTGVDSCAKEWAELKGISAEEYKAHWDIYGKGAGFIRNKFMAQHLASMGGNKCVVLFPGGKGTANMRMEACAVGLPTITIENGQVTNETWGTPIKGFGDA